MSTIKKLFNLNKISSFIWYNRCTYISLWLPSKGKSLKSVFWVLFWYIQLSNYCSIELTFNISTVLPVKKFIGRGQTDKKLTNTLVILNFLSFELANMFFKYGSILLLKTDKKTGDFHPHCQRQRKDDPLDPARHHYAVSTPETLHFLGLYPHGGITSARGYSGKILPCLFPRLREQCAFFVTWWILTHIPGCHQEMVESSPHSHQTHLRRTCSKRPRPVATNPPNPPNFSNTRM